MVLEGSLGGGRGDWGGVSTVDEWRRVQCRKATYRKAMVYRCFFQGENIEVEKWRLRSDSWGMIAEVQPVEEYAKWWIKKVKRKWGVSSMEWK